MFQTFVMNKSYNILFCIKMMIVDDLDDYYNNDDVDYNDVGVVHDVGLMFMMITMMHLSHCRINHYHNNYHLLLLF